MDLLACEEEMMEATPEGAYAGPSNVQEILARRQLSIDLDFNANMDDLQLAYRDPVFDTDAILESMLITEERLHTQVHPHYLKNIQREITPQSRQILACWLYEVCEEERFGETVYLRAMSYLDRSLSANHIAQNQLQLLGITCLILSCKFTGVSFDVKRLILFGEGTITPDLVIDWEIMVAFVLRWELATITPLEFVDHFVPRLPAHFISDPEIFNKAKVYMCFCATDYSFVIHTPSIIASASLAAAIGNRVSAADEAEVVERLHMITNIEVDVIKSVIERIRQKADMCVTVNNQTGTDQENLSDPGSRSPGSKFRINNNNKMDEIGQAETPTDKKTPSTASASIGIMRYSIQDPGTQERPTLKRKLEELFLSDKKTKSYLMSTKTDTKL